MVDPTTLYHSTENSVYRPSIIGILNIEIFRLKLTKKMITAVLMNSTMNTLSMVEMSREFLVCGVSNLVSRDKKVSIKKLVIEIATETMYTKMFSFS
ncbi:MAG: hypothetical protein ACK56F_24780, partial [bacterium]